MAVRAVMVAGVATARPLPLTDFGFPAGAERLDFPDVVEPGPTVVFDAAADRGGFEGPERAPPPRADVLPPVLDGALFRR